MFTTTTRSALIALLSLATQTSIVAGEPAAAATSPYASTTTGVMKSIGCYSSSGDLTNAGTYEYQTSSHCQATCLGLSKPVLGLTQGGDCWCGDLLPAADTEVSLSECNVSCFGYSEPCGGESEWTVWLTGLSASVGSVDGDSASSSTSVASTTSYASSSIVVVASSSTSSSSTSSAAAVTTSSSSSPTTAPTTTTVTPASTTPTTTPTSSTEPTTSAAAPSTVVATVTESGSVQTIIGTTIIAAPTKTAGSESASSTTAAKSSGSSKVGVAVGVVVGILALAGLIGGLVLYFRRRNQRQNSGSEKGHARASSMQDFRNYPIPRLPNLGPQNRASTMNDSRLDPRTMVERRLSQGSMFDNVDYSRKILKVTNPDG